MGSSRTDILSRLQRHLDDLPVLPTVIVDLLRLAPTATDFFEQVTHIVAADPSFTTRLLVAANSALSNPNQQIVRIQDAVARLGAKNVARLITAMSIARVFVPKTDLERNLWRHAFGVAVVAEKVTRAVVRPAPDPSTAYAAGLLHDIGRFLLFQEAPQELQHVDETAWATPQELVDAEQRICGFTHAELGWHAGVKWGLPNALVELIRDHHLSTRGLPPTAATRLIDIVHVADWLAIEMTKLTAADLRDRQRMAKLLDACRNGTSIELRQDQVVAGLEAMAHEIDTMVGQAGLAHSS